MERCPPATLTGVDVGAGVDQHCDDLVVVAGGGGVDRQDGQRVLRSGIDIRAGGNQEAARGLRIPNPEKGREMQGGEAIRAAQRGEAGVRREQLPETVDPTKRSSFEHVELRQCSGDHVGDVVPAVIQGVHRRRDAFTVAGCGQSRIGGEHVHDPH